MTDSQKIIAGFLVFTIIVGLGIIFENTGVNLPDFSLSGQENGQTLESDEEGEVELTETEKKDRRGNKLTERRKKAFETRLEMMETNLSLERYVELDQKLNDLSNRLNRLDQSFCPECSQ